jgi:hypothetical protein
MRWLFLFVLSLNLVYFAWQLSQSSSVDYADVPALKNVESIVLLSELKPQENLVENFANAEPPGDGSVEEMSAEQPDAEPVVGQLQEVIAEVPVAAESVATVEKPVITEVSAAAEIVPAEVVAVELPQQAKCFTLGPFRDLEKLRGLTREIKSYVESADFRGYEEKEQALYWVYVNPEKTRRNAIATGRRLKAKKIKDFYVIREGDKINGVSLGYFRNKRRAYGLAKKAEKLGFDVTVEPIFKTYTVYWLDYQLSDGVSIPESTFDKYIKTGEKDKINRLDRECNG